MNDFELRTAIGRSAALASPERDTLLVRKTLRPPQPGTIKLARRYGEPLLFVRYRENAQGTMRYTTIELVVEATPTDPPATVEATIAPEDEALRERALGLGARWDAESGTWRMSRYVAKILKLAYRAVRK